MLTQDPNKGSWPQVQWTTPLSLWHVLITIPKFYLHPYSLLEVTQLYLSIYLLFFHFSHRGCAANTRGTAFVVYEDIFDAKNACEHLSGFNVCNRYLVVLYYQPHKVCIMNNLQSISICVSIYLHVSMYVVSICV